MEKVEWSWVTEIYIDVQKLYFDYFLYVTLIYSVY